MKFNKIEKKLEMKYNATYKRLSKINISSKEEKRK